MWALFNFVLSSQTVMLKNFNDQYNLKISAAITISFTFLPAREETTAIFFFDS